MADVPVPSIVTATPDGDDTVLGVKDGLVKRFTLDNVGAGINFSAINATTNMAFKTASTERMRISADGNVGIGVTPSNWTSVAGTKPLQIGSYGAHIFGTGSGWSSNAFLYIGNNAYHGDGAWRYTSSMPSAQYVQYSDQHLWYTAPAGTAGNAISYVNTMALYGNGELVVGGPVQASLFKDVDNTAYYLDPANTGTSLNVAGAVIQGVSTTAPTLSANNTLTFSIVDDTTLRISVRGSDGTTRTATITLT